MNDYFIYFIGLTAQLLFSLRLIVQWLFSEKENKIVAPTFFWIVSLIASILFFIYGYLRNDFAIMLGQFITYYIYIRNLQLQNQWNRLRKGIQIVFINFPLIVLLITFLRGEFDFSQLFNQDFIPIWLLALGIVSQLIFTLRFIFQWIISEKNKLSQLPRNGAKNRVRNRCGVTGRPRGYFRYFGLSRIAIRDLASWAQLPGLRKSSW